MSRLGIRIGSVYESMPYSYGREPVYVGQMVLYCVTDLAIQVGPPKCKEHQRVWLPLSQILSTDLDYLSDESLYSEGYVEIPRWLAENEGLI